MAKARAWWRRGGVVGLAALCCGAPVQAQLVACRLPAVLPVPALKAAGNDQARRVVPIGGYTLALSWSPQFCAGRERGGGFQCARRSNRFGFILHGLWPNGNGREWPQYCRPAQRIAANIVRSNLCATPSADLLQHEWAKHGTCMSRTPEAYFDRARSLYGGLRFPDMAALGSRDLTVGRFTRAFIAANAQTSPKLTASAIRVGVSRQGWLEEVRLCLDRQFRFTACPVSAGRAGPAGQTLRIRAGD